MSDQNREKFRLNRFLNTRLKSFLLLFTLYVFCEFTINRLFEISKVLAEEPTEKKTPATSNFINNEFYIGIPIHEISVQIGGLSSKSRSMAGFDLLFRFCNITWFCPHLSYTSSVDTSNGRRPISGPSFGFHTFLLGRQDIALRPGVFQSASSDVFRLYLVSDFAQREFDFRAKSSTNPLEDIVSATRIEGSMWAFAYGVGLEYSIMDAGRFGFEFSTLSSQNTSVKNFSATVTAFVLRYQIK